MHESTKVLQNHIEQEMRSWIHSKSRADEAEIAKIITGAMEDKDGFEYAREQRPAAEIYRELLKTNFGAERENNINARKGKKAAAYKQAADDIYALMGSRNGGKREAFAFEYNSHGIQGMRNRQEDLSLCLSIMPALTCEQINTVLWKFFGESPLHLRNPIDVIYMFVFKARDGKAEGFETLEQQQAYIRELLMMADKELKWGIIENRKKRERSSEAQLLPGTQMLSDNFSVLKTGDPEAFKEWLREAVFHMDIKDRRYTVRQYFEANLLDIARMKEASENATRVGIIGYEPWHDSIGETEGRAFKGGFAIKKFVEAFYSNDNKMFRRSDGSMVPFSKQQLMKVIEYGINGGEKPEILYTRAERKAHGLSEDIDMQAEQDAAEKIAEVCKDVQLFSGMEIAVWSIGLELYALWHELAVEFASDYQDDLPEKFPEREKWQAYIKKLTKGSSSVDALVSEEMEWEPDFLYTLRSYFAAQKAAEKKDPTEKGNEEYYREQAEDIQKAQARFEEFMGDSVLQYILSDWHYACITDKGRRSGFDSSRASTVSNSKLSRLTSRALYEVAAPDRSEVTDVPKSLLILSELAARNARTGEKVNAGGLVQELNRMLMEHGYPLLDIRKRFDYMIYCAISMAAEDQLAQEVLFEEIFDGLYKAIEEYSLAPCRKRLKEIADRDAAKMDAVLREKYNIRTGERQPVKER